MLTGLDPNKPSFAVLPPHWKVADPLSDASIHRAMTMLYGPLMEKYDKALDGPLPVLLRCLANIVFHSDDLIAMMVQYPGHDFNKLRLLHDRELLSRLHTLVTTECTPGVLDKATGIPPHINMSLQLQDVLGKLSTMVVGLTDQTRELVTAVDNAIEKKSWEAGHVSGDRLKAILQEYQKESVLTLRKEIEALKTQFLPARKAETRNLATNHKPPGREQNMYHYDGRFFAVPKNFAFPHNPNLKDGLQLWLKGQTVSVDGNSHVRPFRKLQTSDLPLGVRGEQMIS